MANEPDIERLRRKERISMAKEICSHRGEQPGSIDRRGNEGWEKYEPLAGAVIREAERLLALRASLNPDAQTQQHLGQDHVRKIDAKAGEIPRTVDSGLQRASLQPATRAIPKWDNRPACSYPEMEPATPTAGEGDVEAARTRGSWTQDQFWEYVEGLTDETVRDQMRGMLSSVGLTIGDAVLAVGDGDEQQLRCGACGTINSFGPVGNAQPAPGLWACTGCGSQQSIEQIRGEHPGAIACCPERKMAPALSSTDLGSSK